jgi:hypothetical protein
MIKNIKIQNLFALLLLVIAALFIENTFLQSIYTTDKAYKIINSDLTAQSTKCLTLNSGGEKISLIGTNIPAYPEAERLTFDGGNSVRYRLKATASEVADFYSQKLADQCWKKVNQIASPDSEKLTIALTEDPISKKTVATYTFSSPNSLKVLGVELAQNSEVLPPTGDVYQQPQAPINSQPDNYTPPPIGDGNNQMQPPYNSDQQQQPNQPIPFNPEGNTNTQTCNINGKEMPGPCSSYNNMPPTNQLEFGRPENGSMRQEEFQGQQGPSEEDMQKMDERRFKDMKRGLSQFAKGIKMMKKSAAKTKAIVNKCGVSMPEELENALASADNLVGKIESAKTADELDEVSESIEDVGSVMQEWGPRMGDLHRLCQMIKQGDKDLKQLDRSVKRAETRDKSNKKIDLNEMIVAYKTGVTAMRQNLDEAKQLAKTDPESALEKIEDDFYGEMDNVRNSERAIDMALNISQGIKDATREMKDYQKQIDSLKKKKVDTTEIQAELNSLKSKIEELKSLIKTKFDPDDLVDVVETTFEARETLQDALQELGAGPQMTPQIKVDKNYNTKIDLPDAFKKQENKIEED